MKRIIHHSRATTSLLAMVVSTMSFSLGITYSNTPELPPHKAIWGSPLWATICILAAVWGIYRLFRPKILISYDEEGITIPKHGFIPWAKVESLEACKIGVSIKNSTEADRGQIIDDAIAIHFDENCNFPFNKGFHGSHAYFSSPHCFKFSCSVSYDSRDKILEEMNEVLFRSLKAG